MSGKRVKRKMPEKPADEKPTNEEYAVAKYMKQHVPVKKTKFMYHPVEYFTGTRAVDLLMESPWAAAAVEGGKTPQLFPDRHAVVQYLDTMLRHKFFHRAKKIVITDRDLRRKQLKKLKKKEEQERQQEQEKQEGPEKQESGSESEKEEGGRTEGRAEEEENSNAGETEGEMTPKASRKKNRDEDTPLRKRRVRLDMHLEQTFVDGLDAFVWIYSPIPTRYWLLGTGLVLAIVAVCLFPLWPARLREGVYYLSLAAGGFLVFILVLTLLRTVVFVLVWALTFGRHHIWFLPNLTEDVGFLESFWPLYKYEYRGESTDTKKKIKKSSKTKEKLSDDEAEVVGSATAPASAGSPRRRRIRLQDSQTPPTETQEDQQTGAGEDAGKPDCVEEQSGSEGSQPSNASSTFELLDKE